MASRHHSLDLSELADVTDLVAGFEEHNNVRLSIRFSRVSKQGVPGLMVVAEAWPPEDDLAEVKPLASVNVRCLALNLRTWNAVLTHVMYALDFQLALNEFESAATKKA